MFNSSKSDRAKANSKYVHYLDFSVYNPITNKQESLSDYGGIIINTNNDLYERDCLPEISNITDSNDTRDGEIYEYTKVGSRKITYELLLSTERGWDGDLKAFKGWLMGNRGRQKLTYSEDNEYKEIWVNLNGEMTSKMIYGSYKKLNCKVTISFVAYDPYFNLKQREFICSEEKGTKLLLNTPVTTKTMGNCDCYPLIKIIPNSSSFKFKFNDLNVKFKGVSIGETLYIDCENEYPYVIRDNKKV